MSTTPLGTFGGVREFLSLRPRRARGLNKFAAVEKAPSIKGPKFVLAHLSVPHPPYLFRRSGEPVIEATPSYYEGSELGPLSSASNYYRWLMSHVVPHLHGDCLEVGAGQGTISALLLEGGIDRLYCLEPAANLIPTLRASLDPLGRVDIVPSTLASFAQSTSRTFDCVVCFNVIEHILDDAEAARQLRGLLKQGGHLYLMVPALPWLFGTLDESFGHFRRYTKGRLGGLAREAGLEIVDLRYLNLLGIGMWWLMGKVLKWRTWDDGPVSLYDRFAVPLLRTIEGAVPPPWGQSLLMVARAA